MSTFYSVALNGLSHGQDVVNVLWYRETFEVSSLAEFLSYAEAIAAEVKENIWDSNAPLFVGGRRMRDLMHEDYTLVDITVNAHNDDGALLSTTPYVESVGEAGLEGGGLMGPASYVVLSANLEAAFGLGLGLPSRGHLKLGPISEVQCADDGTLTTAFRTYFADCAGRLAANVVTESPVGLFYPVRVKTTRIAGLITAFGYRDVSSFTVRPVVKILHSRLTEA